MGMNIDDLDDDELLTPITKEAKDLLEYIEDLIEEDHVQYARDTLEGIYESVSNSGYASAAQIRSVENIDQGGQRGRDSRFRRYS